ncbi:MAG: hypothetical protein F6K42_35435 [Leptolyngbya sp. SIO1D8]|nr:hypothetical protein [Leptolyngbya sp. SIO1D8]
MESALAGLRQIRRSLFQQQRRQDIMFPVWMEFELIGLVERWTEMGQMAEVAPSKGFGSQAAGDRSDWTDLCSNTSLDEGDIVRVLRRTLDFLSQVPHVPHISEQLRNNARQASSWINRFPVNEMSP